MPKVQLRPQRISDAKRFYEILNNPNFIYFTKKPASIEAERQWLRKNPQKRKSNLEHNYAVLCGSKVVGSCGVKIDQHRKHIGEIGYFVDEAYWNKGIATKAVRVLEKICFNKLGLVRIEILMNPKNLASERVAIKCGYVKEGTKRKAIKTGKKYFDCHLYAKTR